MTRKELLDYKRAEKLDQLFMVVSQMDTLAFESVEQLESLMSQKASLEQEVALLNERIERLNSNQ